MYTTLIVDDEQLMLRYLEKNLSLLSPDFCVTGIACDGLEAIELLEKQSFDLVITDIKMPEMDGLNLAKYIGDTCKHTKVIIISGYNDFEYARTAIKYGVSDYLLKPISDNSLVETLSSVKEYLKEEAKNKHTPAKDYASHFANEKQLKNTFLSAIIKNNQDDIQPLYSFIKNKDMIFTKSYSCILLLSIDDLSLLLYDKGIYYSSYRYELVRQCQLYCKNHDISFTYDNEGYPILLITEDSEEQVLLLANFIYKDIRDNSWDNNQVHITGAVGCLVSDTMKLSHSYITAMESFALTLKDVKSPISSNHFFSYQNFIHEVHALCEALYYDYVSKNNIKAASNMLLYVNLFEEKINTASILKYGSYLIHYVSRKCNIKSQFIRCAFNELMKGINQIIVADTIDKKHAQELLLQAFKALDHDKILNTLPEASRLIENAKEYICTHYEEQISLMSVADYLDINPTYLSNLFHKVIGEPYTKYIARIRMEKAVLLLKSNPNEKIYVIAEKTGFVSAKHFNHVFKKFYGVTPTEYIKG